MIPNHRINQYATSSNKELVTQQKYINTLRTNRASSIKTQEISEYYFHTHKLAIKYTTRDTH